MVTGLVSLTWPWILFRSNSGSLIFRFLLMGGKLAVFHAVDSLSNSSLVAQLMAYLICSVPNCIGTLFMYGLLLDTMNNESLFMAAIPGI